MLRDYHHKYLGYSPATKALMAAKLNHWYLVEIWHNLDGYNGYSNYDGLKGSVAEYGGWIRNEALEIEYPIEDEQTAMNICAALNYGEIRDLDYATDWERDYIHAKYAIECNKRKQSREIARQARIAELKAEIDRIAKLKD